MSNKAYFLGIDGGQSHTTALVADARGQIVGVGHAGASNHTRAPGGRERLTNAINRSVDTALQQAGLLRNQTVAQFNFASAHLAMTGEPHEKVEIVKELLRAEHLVVGHDALGALAGAHAGGEGVIVLAGTGSVACGEAVDAAGERRSVRVGGRGYLFADEGSAFAIARQAVSLAMRRADRVDDLDELQRTLLKHFKRAKVENIIEDFYAGAISRDQLAAFAARVAALAERGERTAQALIDQAACDLAELADVAVKRLNALRPLAISYGGGVFRGRRLRQRFIAEIERRLPAARVVVPRFGPDVGALLLAYRQAGKPSTQRLLTSLAASRELLK
jgi:N-acetylglucosamine kinase-like BadF-type ATPase